MNVLVPLLFLLVVLGLAENIVHTRRLNSIPVRIHVNGTRGKSTTTRLIAAGLREAGLKVVAKTTGTEARLILEDWTETPVKRKGVPNIREQMKVLDLARRRKADVLVLECMAIGPETLWTSEHRMIRSHIGVITNVREDHLDEMGPGIEQVATALARTIPAGGTLVTAEQRFLPLFRQVAERLGTSVSVVDESEIPGEEIAAFPYLAFKENVACALRVCQLLGVPRETALQGMLKTAPDPGVLRIYRLKTNSKNLFFVNALAANDFASTLSAWNRCSNLELLRGRPFLGVMCNRPDRALRIAELARFAARESQFRYLILLGRPGRLARRLLRRYGMDMARVMNLSGEVSPARQIALLGMLADDNSAVFAFGNHKGQGQGLVEYVENYGEPAL